MPISKFDYVPTQKVMQTYAPLPFDDLLNAGLARQKRYDTSAELIGDVEGIKHAWPDDPWHSTWIKGLQENIDDLSTKHNGDIGTPEFMTGLKSILRRQKYDQTATAVLSNAEKYPVLSKTLSDAKASNNPENYWRLAYHVNTFENKGGTEGLKSTTGNAYLQDVAITPIADVYEPVDKIAKTIKDKNDYKYGYLSADGMYHYEQGKEELTKSDIATTLGSTYDATKGVLVDEVPEWYTKSLAGINLHNKAEYEFVQQGYNPDDENIKPYVDKEYKAMYGDLVKTAIDAYTTKTTTSDKTQTEAYGIGYKYKLENPIIPLTIRENGITTKTPSGGSVKEYKDYISTLDSTVAGYNQELKAATGSDFSTSRGLETLKIFASRNYASSGANGKQYDPSYWADMYSKILSVNDNKDMAEQRYNNALKKVTPTLSTTEKALLTEYGKYNLTDQANVGDILTKYNKNTPSNINAVNIAQEGKEKALVLATIILTGRNKVLSNTSLDENKKILALADVILSHDRAVKKLNSKIDVDLSGDEVTLDNYSTNNYTTIGPDPNTGQMVIDPEGGAKIMKAVGAQIGENGSGLSNITVTPEIIEGSDIKEKGTFSKLFGDKYKVIVNTKGITTTVLPSVDGGHLGYIIPVTYQEDKTGPQKTQKVYVSSTDYITSATDAIEQTPEYKIQQLYVNGQAGLGNTGKYSPSQFKVNGVPTVTFDYTNKEKPIQIMEDGVWTGYSQDAGIKKLGSGQ